MAFRIIVHDYGGYPFPVDLSRALAGRGHHVLHLHCSAYRSGKGALERRPADPLTFTSEAVPLARFDKHALLRRATQEWSYGRTLSRRIAVARPDVVISANTPLVSQMLALRASRRVGSSFVYWLQDLISVAGRRLVGERVPFGDALAFPLTILERRMLAASDSVIAISDDFRSTLEGWGIPPASVAVIENWAPVEELPELRQDNEWARRHGLADKRVVLYAGTLGLKHNPELLLALARRLRGDGDVRVVVVSEGSGAERLVDAKRIEGLDGLVVLPFQPFERLPEVMASATVLVAILERDAGLFSVPSKILSYLCAGRAIVAALPAGNLAARTLLAAGAGVVTDPDDAAAFAEATASFLTDDTRRDEAGRSARDYALAAFKIATITDRFEDAIDRVRRPASSAPANGLVPASRTP
jgi:colanic acid biosynthesis glycosyl transferase WcaI